MSRRSEPPNTHKSCFSLWKKIERTFDPYDVEVVSYELFSIMIFIRYGVDNEHPKGVAVNIRVSDMDNKECKSFVLSLLDEKDAELAGSLVPNPSAGCVSVFSKFEQPMWTGSVLTALEDLLEQCIEDGIDEEDSDTEEEGEIGDAEADDRAEEK